MDMSMTSVEEIVSDLSEPEERTVRPVDLVHLARQTLGDRSLECEVLGLFRCQSLTTMEKLRSASTLQEWNASMHVLKGSARAIGAWDVAEMAQQAETFSEADWTDKRPDVVNDLETKISQTNSYIDSLLADR